MGNSNSAQRHSTTVEKVISTSNPSLISKVSSTGRHRVASLDLPDLVFQPSRNAATAALPPPSASIPIPLGGDFLRRHNRGEPDPGHGIQPSKHIPVVLRDRNKSTLTQSTVSRAPSPAASRVYGDTEEEAEFPPPALGNFDLHETSLPRAPPPIKHPKVTLLSSLPAPIRLEDRQVVPIDTTITWTGGGDRVMIARAGDDDWKHRQIMRRPTPYEPHSIIIPLLPGTHHVGFLVDGVWRVADDLPRAVDDKGSLANYITVGPGSSHDDPADLRFTSSSFPTSPTVDMSEYPFIPAPLLKATRVATPGHSFWSSVSVTDSDDPWQEELTIGTVQVIPPSRHRKPASKWTDEIPTELEQAVHEEDEYLRHLAEQTEQSATTTRKINGFIPMPHIPEPPYLPRHLDKIILNERPPTSQPQNVTSSSSPRSRGSRRDRAREALVGPETFVEPPAEPAPPKPEPIVPSVAVPNSLIDDTVAADDTSVLPVPSHVALRHLTTSAIKNGVLAVGTTVRYKEKFLTTIYYKPTDT